MIRSFHQDPKCQRNCQNSKSRYATMFEAVAPRKNITALLENFSTVVLVAPGCIFCVQNRRFSAGFGSFSRRDEEVGGH